MEIMTIPILCGELPKFIGAICYEGDKNVKRLEFTGAEPGLQYKLDMERTDGVKNVVDLENQNGTLILCMDGSVRIPAGRYQVQLRTVGEVVRHTNKAFLTVRDSIDAVNAFASGMPTEMEQMEKRLTDAMHRSEESAARAEDAAESVKAEAFIAEFDVTSWTDVTDAWNAGKLLFCRKGKYLMPLYSKDENIALFRVSSKESVLTCKLTKHDAWVYDTARHPQDHTHTIANVTGLNTKLSALEKRIAALESGDET